MGLIYTQDFIRVADAAITARSTTAGFADVDIMDFWHLKARHRAADLTKSDTNPLFRIDMGAAKTVVAVYISDCNYNKVRIRAHASDLTTNWSTSTYNGGDVTLSLNPWTGRYQGFVPAVFNLRWLAICTPAAASAVGSYVTYWETGVVAIMDSVTQLSAAEHGYPFAQLADHAVLDVGRSGRVSLSDVLAWQGELTYQVIESAEAELMVLNRAGRATPMLLYFNAGDTSQAYLCLRDDPWRGEITQYNSVQGKMRFREIVGM